MKRLVKSQVCCFICSTIWACVLPIRMTFLQQTCSACSKQNLSCGTLTTDITEVSRSCKLSNEDIAETEGLRDVAMATDFGIKIAITGFV